MHAIIWLYDQHAAEWDAEFGRVRDRFADRMRCGKGCSMCCSQMFSISALESAVIAEAVAALSEAERDRLTRAAREYVEQAARLGVTTEADGEESITPRPGVRLTCPALHDDACSIYEARPLICRKWGIPVYDPSAPDRLHACELNFKAGESIEAGDLVDRQRALLERWTTVKRETRGALADEHRRSTVGEAILSCSSPHRRAD